MEGWKGNGFREDKIVRFSGERIGLEKLAQVDAYQQKTQWSCSAGSLVAVAKHHGIDITEEQAVKAIGAREGRGAETTDIVEGARKLGLEAWEGSFPSLDSAKEVLKAGNPIIADVQSFNYKGKGHYIVIAGYKPGKGFILMDPNTKGKTAIPNWRILSDKEMEKKWWDRAMAPPHKLMMRWGVVVTPKEKEKTAASVVRGLFKLVEQSPGLGSVRRFSAMLGDKEIGKATFKKVTKDYAQIGGVEIDEKFRGMGLGRKLYGELTRRAPKQTLRSDDGISPLAEKSWMRMMDNNPGQVSLGPDYVRVMKRPMSRLPSRRMRKEPFEEKILSTDYSKAWNNPDGYLLQRKLPRAAKIVKEKTALVAPMPGDVLSDPNSLLPDMTELSRGAAMRAGGAGKKGPKDPFDFGLGESISEKNVMREIDSPFLRSSSGGNSDNAFEKRKGGLGLDSPVKIASMMSAITGEILEKVPKQKLTLRQNLRKITLLRKASRNLSKAERKELLGKKAKWAWGVKNNPSVEVPGLHPGTAAAIGAGGGLVGGVAVSSMRKEKVAEICSSRQMNSFFNELSKTGGDYKTMATLGAIIGGVRGGVKGSEKDESGRTHRISMPAKGSAIGAALGVLILAGLERNASGKSTLPSPGELRGAKPSMLGRLPGIFMRTAKAVK